ncbi:leucine-rich PPR motif-containing protein, mitochondrial-like isoform X2 [Amphiura filiformis]|uniref:leucine-rich PPR motif-containing protein, mitochondrial-like isoform X1 n=1 Tax=Amphiura filiformis TaxID=82378 RepID=UPI003B214A74
MAESTAGPSHTRAMREFEDMVHSRGEVSKQKFMSVYNALCNAGSVTPNQAILLIRSCGSLLKSLPSEERNDLLVQVWDKLAELGIHYDVTHYNALLMAYLENGYKFSPMELLAQMESKGVEPNRITYQRLIKAYCRQGDVQGATLILNVLKSKGLTVTESVFNSLIEGNAKAGDIESARKIIDSMRDLGIEPSLDTYTALASVYVEQGDKDKIKEVMSEAEASGFTLTPNFYFKIIHGLTSSGHKEHVKEFVDKVDLRYSTPDAIRLAVDLWGQGGYEESFTILQSLKHLDNKWARQRSVQEFIETMVTSSSGPGTEKLIDYLDQIHELHLHEEPYTHALQQSLRTQDNTELSLAIMKKMQDKNIPVRTHYFYPLLAKKRHLSKKNEREEGVLSVISTMLGMGIKTEPETYSEYVMGELPDNFDEIMELINDTPLKDDQNLYTGYCQHVLARKLPSQTLETIEKLYELQPAITESRRFRTFVSSYLNRSQAPHIPQFAQLLKKISEHTPAETNALSVTGDDDFELDDFVKKDPLGSYIYHSINLIHPQRFGEKWMHVKALFKELKAQNMHLQCNSVRGIRNVLKARQVRGKGVEEFLLDLVDQEELLADPSGFTDLLHGDVLSKVDVSGIEEKLKELKEQGGDDDLKIKLFSKLIEIHALQKNADRVNELLEEWKELGLGETTELKKQLIMVHCRLGNLEEALQIKQECETSGTPITDPYVICSLVSQLVKNGQMEEAFELLRGFDVTRGRGQDIRMSLTRAMEELSEQGLAQEVQDVYQKCVDLQIFRPQDSPFRVAELLQNAYINSNDLRGAINSMAEVHKQFKISPDTHRLLCMLVESGDKSLLQECLHSVTEIHGGVNMIHSLAFAFLECKKYDEAEKLFKAPGIAAKMDRITWFVDRCLAQDNVEQVRKLIELSSDVYGMDKETVCYYQMRLYAEKENNVDKCLQLYTQLEEEDVPLRARTLRYLASVLRSRGLRVPFAVPVEEEISFERRPRPAQGRQEDGNGFEGKPRPVKAGREQAPETHSEKQLRVKFPADLSAVERIAYLVKEHKDVYETEPNVFLRLLYGSLGMCGRESVESFAAAKEALQEIPDLFQADRFRLMEMNTYINHNDIPGAHNFYSSILADGKEPKKDLVSKLGRIYEDNGDVDSLVKMRTEYMEKVKDVEFPCNYLIVGAYAKKNDISGAVQYLKEQKAAGVPSMHLGIFHLFNKAISKELPMDELLELVEEYAKEGETRPKRNLCQAYVFAGKREKALQLIEAAEDGSLKGSLLPVAIKVCQRRTPPVEADIIRWIIDINNVEGTDLGTLYWYLIRAYHANNDLEGAHSVYQEMTNANLSIGDLELKRLAVVFKNHNQQVPFEEPPESLSYYVEQIAKAAKDKAAERLEV